MRTYVGTYVCIFPTACACMKAPPSVCVPAHMYVRRKEDSVVLGSCLWKNNRYYLPTPPLGQDMTQGQFLSGV